MCIRDSFNATLKTKAAIEDTKVITDYHKDLDRREAKAKAAGRAFPKALYLALYRPTELSLQFIRWLRSHLMLATCYRAALALLRPLMAQYFAAFYGQGSARHFLQTPCRGTGFPACRRGYRAIADDRATSSRCRAGWPAHAPAPG